MLFIVLLSVSLESCILDRQAFPTLLQGVSNSGVTSFHIQSYAFAAAYASIPSVRNVNFTNIVHLVWSKVA